MVLESLRGYLRGGNVVVVDGLRTGEMLEKQNLSDCWKSLNRLPLLQASETIDCSELN